MLLAGGRADSSGRVSVSSLYSGTLFKAYYSYYRIVVGLDRVLQYQSLAGSRSAML